MGYSYVIKIWPTFSENQDENRKAQRCVDFKKRPNKHAQFSEKLWKKEVKNKQNSFWLTQAT